MWSYSIPTLLMQYCVTWSKILLLANSTGILHRSIYSGASRSQQNIPNYHSKLCENINTAASPTPVCGAGDSTQGLKHTRQVLPTELHTLNPSNATFMPETKPKNKWRGTVTSPWKMHTTAKAAVSKHTCSVHNPSLQTWFWPEVPSLWH
jgi:hypothetical protein